MRRPTPYLLAIIVHVLAAIASIFSIVAFATGTPTLSSAVAAIQGYLTNLAPDTPAIIRWPVQAGFWLLRLAFLLLYRHAILFGVPLLAAVPAGWIVWFWIRFSGKHDDEDYAWFGGALVYMVALIWFVIALNSNRSFSIRLGMG